MGCPVRHYVDSFLKVTLLPRVAVAIADIGSLRAWRPMSTPSGRRLKTDICLCYALDEPKKRIQMLFEATEQAYTARLADFSNVEFAMASIYEAQGFATIHHDYYLFHESAKTKYPQNEQILKSTIGAERLTVLREVCRNLYPMDAGPGQRPEQPDLFVFKPDGDFFFSEVKRKKTGDYLRAPQMVGISLIKQFLGVHTELATVLDEGEREPTKLRTFQWVWPSVQETGFHKVKV